MPLPRLFPRFSPINIAKAWEWLYDDGVPQTRICLDTLVKVFICCKYEDSEREAIVDRV